MLSSKAESATTTPNEQSTYFSSFCSSFVEQGGKGSAQRHFLPWRFQEVVIIIAHPIHISKSAIAALTLPLAPSA
ncbi:MAG: hypothetical protein WCJ66_14540, partial [Verrucomicrobiota bacterium]